MNTDNKGPVTGRANKQVAGGARRTKTGGRTS